MPERGKRTLIVSGHAVAPKGTVLHERNKMITIVLEIDKETEEIISAESTFITSLSRSFLNDLLVGHKILREHDEIREVIERNFIVDSQKSLLKALGIAADRYRNLIAKKDNNLY